MAELHVKQSPRGQATWWTATLILVLCGCANLTERAQRMARHDGLDITLVQGTAYRHEIFVNTAPRGEALFVFIEGDGSPWSRDGQEPARDPTPHHPLALELAVRTPHSILYLGRPCYFSARSDAACRASVWTSERYSSGVVESLAAVVNRIAANNGFRRVALIGYSGGGTLAVLMAPHIPSTSAVVTIAANLDITSWANWHGYRPLDGSLNPVTQPPLDTAIQQRHLLGGLDENVPERVSRAYLDRLNTDQIWRFESFDHVCCWVEQWPNILGRIDTALGD